MKKNIIFLLISFLLILPTCINEPLNPLSENVKSHTEDKDTDKDTDKDKDSDDPENQASGHVIAKYMYCQWGPCGYYIEIYEKSNNNYTRTLICPSFNTTNQMNISEEEFNTVIYISSLMEYRNDLIESDALLCENLINNYPEIDIDNCMTSTNIDIVMVGYNINGIITYFSFRAVGPTDVWYNRKFISFSNIVN